MSALKGIVSLLLLIVITLFWGIPLFILIIVKLVTPTRRWRRQVLLGLIHVAQNWLGSNLWWMRRWLKPQLSTQLPKSLSAHKWWLVISNHQSWTDIFMLQLALHRRIPMPRFFLKRELIWLPIVGQACWALEFPFMRRYSRTQLERNPALANIDREATIRSCRQAREVPSALYNFVEGTRFTPAKRDAQASPYRHLLRPKAGGIAQVLSVMGDRLDGILDVTIHYVRPQPTFWRFLCGREAAVTLHARHIDVPDWMPGGDYHQDPYYKERVHTWLNGIWEVKDGRLDAFSSPS
ncbi:acyltransferase [Litchfieldella xinjiangensis]|uniref:acyltransferase n=1 Tax=Litchfieldella xinjiangensis TaxID=1166948 RepID=UPI0005BE5EA8|nr:acyltransferase [Halomonas xinjiangensis]